MRLRRWGFFSSISSRTFSLLLWRLCQGVGLTCVSEGVFGDVYVYVFEGGF